MFFMNKSVLFSVLVLATILFSACFTPPPPSAVCGNGIIEGGEQCDDGQGNGLICEPEYGSSCEYCSEECTLETNQGAFCGDGSCNGPETQASCPVDCGQQVNLEADYYVDYQAGSDSNNGKSTNAPFKHAPGDPSATGIAASTVLQPGDIVKFKGGVVYPRQIYVTRSGSQGNNIVYDGNTDGSWGSGRAVMDLGHMYNQAFVSGSSDYITVQGFDIMRAKDPATGGNGGIIRLENANHDWVIRKNVFSRTQNWNFTCGINGGSGFLDSQAIFTTTSGGGAYNIIIEENEFFALGRTIIGIRSGHDFIIRNNDFGGINRGEQTGWFSVALRLEVTPRNILIQGNNFHDGWQYGGDESSTELCHANDYIHTYNTASGVPDGGPGPDNVTVENNIFMIDKQFNYDHGTAYMSISRNSHNFNIRNNLFVNMPGNAIIVVADYASNISITNNHLIMREHTRDGWLLVLDIYSNALEYIRVRNNIIWSDMSNEYMMYVRDTVHERDIDYNVYYHAKGMAKPFVGGGSTRTFNEWQALGYDLHGSYGDPKFVYMPADPAQSSLGNYQLQANSPAVDSGIVIAGYSDSLNGVPRPQGSAWDIGAYER